MVATTHTGTKTNNRRSQKLLYFLEKRENNPSVKPIVTIQIAKPNNASLSLIMK